jgi:hypothetical protein
MLCMAACAAIVDALRPALFAVACGSVGSKKPWLCCRALCPKGWPGMLGEGILMEPSTEVRITGREKFCRLLVLCEGVGPPDVDGRTPGADMTGCC